ncbi:tetratricopeptide repeat protein [Peptostreptococcus canis]|uniref:Tetratricopeptide repeat protein n=1 Tax=Peptostreptococcus canis TaxID=1159213 RepID=A0ABR6TLF7_9FIRM|nr:tetratricopeptide repeat protein [Peptostreptococcus canis]MBC2576247.1 tetratricopeptide repeat protein [Peptostreptococcus canis]MBP1998217.1 tetratricopeptide (TPR) repeat protein [Peptostreptococcus canis]
MKTRIDKYILEKSEELVFITIDETNELSLEGYEVPEGGLKVPLKSDVLVKSIKDNKAQEELNMMSMVDAMLFIQGVDEDFMYNCEYDKFIEFFSKKVNFDYMQYLGFMSNKSYTEGEITDALVYIKSFLRREPENVDALYQFSIICQELAIRYQKDEELESMNDFLMAALYSLEKIVDLDDKFSLAYYQLGFHYSNQKQFVKSKLIWEKALDYGIDEDLAGEIQDNLEKIDFKVRYEEGYNLVFQGRAEEGLQKLLPLEQDNPDWWNLLFIISVAYKSLGDLGEAKKYLEKILIIRPTQVDTLVEMALCLAEEGNLEGAIEFLTKASKLRKDNPEILCNLGMAYLHNGNYDEAKYYIEMAYEIDPTDEVTVACMRQL